MLLGSDISSNSPLYADWIWTVELFAGICKIVSFHRCYSYSVVSFSSPLNVSIYSSRTVRLCTHTGMLAQPCFIHSQATDSRFYKHTRKHSYLQIGLRRTAPDYVINSHLVLTSRSFLYLAVFRIFFVWRSAMLRDKSFEIPKSNPSLWSISTLSIRKSWFFLFFFVFVVFPLQFL